MSHVCFCLLRCRGRTSRAFLTALYRLQALSIVQAPARAGSMLWVHECTEAMAVGVVPDDDGTPLLLPARAVVWLAAGSATPSHVSLGWWYQPCSSRWPAGGGMGGRWCRWLGGGGGGRARLGDAARMSDFPGGLPKLDPAEIQGLPCEGLTLDALRHQAGHCVAEKHSVKAGDQVVDWIGSGSLHKRARVCPCAAPCHSYRCPTAAAPLVCRPCVGRQVYACISASCVRFFPMIADARLLFGHRLLRPPSRHAGAGASVRDFR